RPEDSTRRVCGRAARVRRIPASASPPSPGPPARGGGPGGAGRRGDRRPAVGRPWPGAFPPRRCAATGSGSAGKASGGQVARRRASGGRVLEPPGSRSRRIPGPRERTAAAPSPAPAVRGPPRLAGGGPRPAGERGPGPPAPGAAVNRGGLRSVRPDRAAPQGRARPRSGARGPRRCRLPTRPVLKHGPRSLARARVRGRPESPRRNEGEGRRAPAEVGSRGVASEKPRAHHRPVSPVPPGRGGGA
ncbi:uncharacterized protein ACIB01_001461, partial [Guaruba guarouba]